MEHLANVDPGRFVEAMRRVTNSVTIVTTDGPAGRFGITVSAMASVSAEPPVLLVCLNRRSPARDAAVGNGRFAVNILAEHQVPAALTFAGRPVEGAPFAFAAAAWRETALGLPVLEAAAASFECMLHDRVEAGTHTTLFGRVVQAEAGRAEPLLYGDRGFRPRPLSLAA